MDASTMSSRSESFGRVAGDYARFRPDYPEEAVRWLVGSSPGRVLELGAGTGLLTRRLVALGHEVVACDPAAPMLRHLHSSVPSAAPLLGRAEAIPLRSASVDVVVSAQAFHWFDPDRALPEIARVLRPGGVLALVWNSGDRKVPWVKRVFELIDQPDSANLGDPVAGSDLFSPSDSRVFRHWQQMDEESLVGFVGSTSTAATMPEEERSALLAEVRQLYESYDRGPSGMLMPWRAYGYRARVSGLAAQVRGSSSDGYDDALLIDFN
jgi:SAM-dependent methyltransferase